MSLEDSPPSSIKRSQKKNLSKQRTETLLTLNNTKDIEVLTSIRKIKTIDGIRETIGRVIEEIQITIKTGTEIENSHRETTRINTEIAIELEKRLIETTKIGIGIEIEEIFQIDIEIVIHQLEIRIGIGTGTGIEIEVVIRLVEITEVGLTPLKTILIWIKDVAIEETVTEGVEAKISREEILLLVFLVGMKTPVFIRRRI